MPALTKCADGHQGTACLPAFFEPVRVLSLADALVSDSALDASRVPVAHELLPHKRATAR